MAKKKSITASISRTFKVGNREVEAPDLIFNGSRWVDPIREGLRPVSLNEKGEVLEWESDPDAINSTTGMEWDGIAWRGTPSHIWNEDDREWQTNPDA